MVNYIKNSLNNIYYIDDKYKDAYGKSFREMQEYYYEKLLIYLINKSGTNRHLVCEIFITHNHILLTKLHDVLYSCPKYNNEHK
jgi:hypothetical protein